MILTTRITTFKALAAAVLAVAMGSTGQAQFYNLGGGNSVSGLSFDGSVGAGSAGDGFFTWTAAGGVNPIGGTPSAGQAKVSNDGTRISGTNLNSTSNQIEMSYYDTTTGNWNDLGGIGAICTGGSNDETSSGWGISGDGSSVVGLGWFDFCGPAHAVQWDESTGVLGDLGSTVNDRSSRANGTNMDGSVVVGWQDREDGFRQAAVWDNGVQQVLSTAAGDPLSEASDVDAAGIWVVGSGGFATDNQPWRWSAATGVELLGNLSGDRGTATGISDDGSVIVGFERGFGPFAAQTGFVWTEATGILNINDYVDSFGIDRQGLDLALPLTVSGDGQTIGGATAVFFGEGYVVTVPEPASGMLLLSAVFAAMAARRRRR